MARNVRSAITLFFLCIAVPSMAGELYRLHVDLDGDGRAEVIRVVTSAASEEWRRKFTVHIGSSSYSGEYFGEFKFLPDVRVVVIDYKQKQRQLLLGTPEAGSCNYHLLAYSDKKVIPLLQFEAGADCTAPDILGNGKLSTSLWQGFWFRRELYSLTPGAKALVPIPQTIYAVGVTGGAAKSFKLQGGKCPPREIAPNDFLRIAQFDSEQNRYFVESLNGGCGWVPFDDINDLVKELPWAG